MSSFAAPLIVFQQLGIDNGTVPVVKSVTINHNSNSNAVPTTQPVFPANCRLLRITIDNITGWNAATSAALTIGSALGGTQYAPSTSVLVAAQGRIIPTHTVAQLTAMANIGANTTVFCQVAPAGGGNTQGSLTIHFEYVPAG